MRRPKLLGFLLDAAHGLEVNHDIVAIGGSAGGIEVLLDMVGELPGDLAASLFVVVHLPAGHTSLLPELLAKRCRLDVRHPLHEEPIKPRTIYIAPPDMHVQLRPGSIEVVRGPKDNGHRPAADVLFRSASRSYGSRVIGVVLSGYQDCGTAGMMSIKARGGLGVVQDPASAIAAEMPRHVIQRVAVDHIVHPFELGALLTKLVATPAGPNVEPNTYVKQLEGDEKGIPADVVCPICDGVLTEAQPGVFEHFRCHVGHAFTLESLVQQQSEQMERVMWAAIRALEESAALARRISSKERGELEQRFAEKAATQLRHADYIRGLVLHAATLTENDARKVG